MKFYQIILIVFISIVSMGCSCEPPKPPVTLETPEITFEALRYSIQNDEIAIFYHCLAQEIKDQYSYFEVSSGWEEVKKQFKINPNDVKRVETKRLVQSPFPEYDAAYIIAAYKDEEDKVYREKLLFLQQPDVDADGKDVFYWRIYYPFMDYQGVDVLTLEKE